VATERFVGKVVWITGASSGIGRALALAWSRAGARLILSARQLAHLEPVRQACSDPGQVRLVPFDLADLEAIPAAVQRALAEFGQVDYMVHNAAIALRETLLDTPLELDQRVMTTNYFGPLVLTRALLPSMLARRTGRFVVISSLSGKHGVPKLSAYAAAKHALHGAFESLRTEVHDQGIRITMIIPGFVRTPILERALTGSGTQYGRTLESYQRGMDPDRCANRILGAVARGKEEALVGGWELSSLYLQRFFPRLFRVVMRNHPVQLRMKLIRILSFGLAGRVKDAPPRRAPVPPE